MDGFGQGAPMRRALFLSALSSPAMILAPPAWAQAADGEENEDRPATIVVTAGLPATPGEDAYATSRIERERIVSAPSGRIEEVLGNVAGFQQFRRSDSRSSNPSAQGVTLRALGGNASSRALVTLDGVPQADPFFGYIPLPSLAPETLSSITVTRGGGSGPFGGGALAGTIALESAGPDTLGLFTASALVNDRGETEASVAAAPTLGDGFVVATGRWDRGEGFFTAPEDQRVAASVPAAFESLSGGLRVVQPVGADWTAEVRGRAFQDDRTLRFAGADSSSSGQDFSARLSRSGNGNGNGNGNGWGVDALAYVQRRDFSNIVISSTSFVPVLDQRETPSTGIGGKIELRPPVGRDTVVRLGTDLRIAEGDIAEDRISAASANVFAQRESGGRTSDVGFFAEIDRSFGPLVLTGGLRADRTAITGGFQRDFNGSGGLTGEENPADRSDWGVTWRGGAAYSATPDITVRAAAYRGFRLPTLNELYRPFVIFPVVTLANPDLENEELVGYEAGLDWNGAGGASGARVSLTVFDNRLENAIANVTLGPDLRQRRNLAAIEARGVEAAFGYTTGPIRFDASLAYTDAVVVDETAGESEGTRPPQSPEFSAAATLGWAVSNTIDLSASLRHVGDQFEDDAGQDVLPAFTTLGAFASWRFATRFSLVMRAENLFDTKIVTRNSGGDQDLGAPRTVWIGIRSGF